MQQKLESDRSAYFVLPDGSAANLKESFVFPSRGDLTNYFALLAACFMADDTYFRQMLFELVDASYSNSCVTVIPKKAELIQ